ncbi:MULTISPECIES: carboxypeptidase regulatory-like domain-containing protein [Pasteurellaceae]|uniref:carboxypeptidase regulatory-like domain-containing protein n=1 Tax=Pasteurellaceae TaxID=712 RepID=UPI0035665A21
MKTVAFLTALFAWFGAQPALAHSLYLFAQYDGRTVSGKAYYSDMTPAAETYLAVFHSGQAAPVLEGKTDGEGRFAYPLSAEGGVKVVVEGAEGHKAAVVADRIALQAANSGDNALMLVREDIAKLKDKMYLHDILGGIGYILGIVGLWALARAAKLTRKSQAKEN